MPYSIAIANLKGGTGKTTTAVNLAYGLARLKVPVLLVEIDPLGPISRWLQVEPLLWPQLESWTRHEIEEQIHTAKPHPYLDVLAADPKTAPFLSDWPHWIQTIVSAKGSWQTIIFDCPPGQNRLSLGALEFTQGIIVPVSTLYMDIWTLEDQIRVLRVLRGPRANQKAVRGRLMILPTFFDRRESRSWKTLHYLERVYPKFLGPVIRKNVRLCEAPLEHRSIFDYAPRSFGAIDYGELATIIRREWLKWKIRAVGPTMLATKRRNVDAAKPRQQLAL